MGQTLFDKVWKKHVLHGKEGERYDLKLQRLDQVF
jgi:hypothetical protein